MDTKEFLGSENLNKTEARLVEKINDNVIKKVCESCDCYGDCYTMNIREKCEKYYKQFDAEAKAYLESMREPEKLPTAIAIETCLDNMKHLLIQKNLKYGNSALEPLGIFSKDGAQNSIRIRLDDKLSRIRNSNDLRKNDVADMIGYLTLLCVANGWTNFEELID